MPTKRASVAKKSASKKASAKKSSAKKKPVAAKKSAGKKVVAAKAKKSAAKKPAVKKTAAKASARAVSSKKPAAKAPAKVAPSKKPAAAATPKAAPAKAEKTAAAPSKRAAPAEAPAKKWGKRADLGNAIDAFFLKQPPHLRPILEELRRLVNEAAPTADSSIKWGMPFFTLNGTMMCALGAHKSHVNLILSGPPGTYADPEGRLAGDGKTGRHLKLTALEDLPTASVRTWLRTAVDLANKG